MALIRPRTSQHTHLFGQYLFILSQQWVKFKMSFIGQDQNIADGTLAAVLNFSTEVLIVMVALHRWWLWSNLRVGWCISLTFLEVSLHAEALSLVFLVSHQSSKSVLQNFFISWLLGREAQEEDILWANSSSSAPPPKLSSTPWNSLTDRDHAASSPWTTYISKPLVRSIYAWIMGFYMCRNKSKKSEVAIVS